MSLLSCAQLTGVPIVPFNVQKQTALLSVMWRKFPRLALGVGPTQTQIVSVVDNAVNQTSQVTLVVQSSGAAQTFAEVLSAHPFRQTLLHDQPGRRKCAPPP